MFGISLPELLIIIIVALLILKPSDLPTIGRHYRSLLKSLNQVKSHVRSFYDQTHNFLLEQNEHKQSYIKGDDGRYHRAYDVEELQIVKKKPRRKKPPSFNQS